MTYMAKYNGMEDETPESWLVDDGYITNMLCAGMDGLDREEAEEVMGKRWKSLTLHDGMDRVTFEPVEY